MHLNKSIQLTTFNRHENDLHENEGHEIEKFDPGNDSHENSGQENDLHENENFKHENNSLGRLPIVRLFSNGLAIDRILSSLTNRDESKEANFRNIF